MRKLLRSNLLLIMFLVGAASGFLVSNAGWWSLYRGAQALEDLRTGSADPLQQVANAHKVLVRSQGLFLDALRKQNLSDADAAVLRSADAEMRALLATMAVPGTLYAGQWQRVAERYDLLADSRRQALHLLQQDPQYVYRFHAAHSQPLSNQVMAALAEILPEVVQTSATVYESASASNAKARALLLGLSLLASIAFCLIAALTYREAVNRRLQSAERDREHTMFRTLFQASNDGVILLEGGRISDLNRAALAMFGVPADQEISELDLARLQPRAAESRLLEQVAAAAPVSQRFEHVFRALDGREFPAEVALDVARLAGNNIVQLTVRDITHRRQAENSMRLANQAFENSLEGIAITDAHGCILTINSMFSTITGYTREDVVGRNPRMLSSGRQTQDFYDEMWQALHEQGKWQGEIWNKRKNGEIYPQWLTISRVCDEHGKPTNFVGVFSDITERKSAEERILHQVYYDQLTDLPNRVLFNDRLNQVLGMAKRRDDQPFAVMFLDLDRFKLINDTMGHQAGDQLLQQAAHRLRGSVRESDTVARMSGDEFTILLSEIAYPKHAANVAQKIVDAFRKPFQLNGEDVYVSPSIGISVYPQDGRTIDVLLKNADMAMYRAKGSGGAAYELFDAGLATMASERLTMETALHKALERNELELLYQPQFDCDNGKLQGFEALVRWRHPERGLLLPEAFLPIAEESGLILPIGEWVLRHACAQAQAWRQDYPGHRLIAVNLSARQFHAPDLSRQVAQALQRSGLPSFCLELEVTESAIMKDLNASVAIMHQLTDMGVQFSIDDFGTGHSSLSLLKQLPIHALKVDESFIRDLDVDEDDASIVNAVVMMAGRLGLRVVAEGVEQHAQLALLRKHKGVIGQGALLGEPVSAEQAAHLMTDGHLKLAAA